MAVFYRFQDSGLDDWDKSNNYVQMGFRPGFAIQARELTQMQTVLQAQITALARRFLKSGSIIDAGLTVTRTGSTWAATLGAGYLYIEPLEKDLGYFVHNNETLTIGGISIIEGQTTWIYVRWEEIQANPDGPEHPAGGGFAKVIIDPALKDNAQGYSNYSAPGASRYQINIVGGGSFSGPEGNLPPNSAIFATIPPPHDQVYYYDTGNPV